jgi:AraC-like DNA-binding protein
MVDPLADIVGLLRPRSPFSKLVSAAGPWRVGRSESGRAFYCAVLETGDFVLIPAAFNFSMSSHNPPSPGIENVSTVLADGEIRHGDPECSADIHMVVGYCIFDTPDVALLTSLLPESVFVRSEPRLVALMELVRDEARHLRPGKDVILAHLLEVLLIEALRSSTEISARPGLLRGLADDRLAAAIRRIHENPAEQWTITRLAREAALSRSVFFERFRREVGASPMDYVLAWRMSLAKDLLRDGSATVAEVAAKVGYSTSSTFSVAFTRHVGLPPSRYARQLEHHAS